MPKKIKVQVGQRYTNLYTRRTYEVVAIKGFKVTLRTEGLLDIEQHLSNLKNTHAYHLEPSWASKS